MTALVVTDAFFAAWLQCETGRAPRIERRSAGRAAFSFDVSSPEVADELRSQYAASHTAQIYATFQNLLRVIR